MKFLRQLPLWIVVCLLFALPAVLSSQAQAQATAEPGRQSSSGAATEVQQAGAESPGQQLAEQSREAAGEDTQQHLKQSPSVRFISRLTGLSMKGAFWLGQLFNFVIITAFIVWASKKNLPGMFRSRTVSIQKAMAEARKSSDEANRRLSEIEARLSRLDVEIGEMRMTADKEAVAEEERIKAATTEDARKILESAEQEIAAAAKSARRELTAYAADLAVSLARKQIRVDPATDEMLVRGFADQLPTSNGAGPKRGKDRS